VLRTEKAEHNDSTEVAILPLRLQNVTGNTFSEPVVLRPINL
jgi:hypothetical protein